MTFTEMQNFLREIVGIYPKFQIMDGTIKAWAERLKECPPEKAEELLSEWLESDQSKYAPQLDFFIKGMKPKKTTAATWATEPVLFHVGTGLHKGCLFDQFGREYGSETATGDYYTDQYGRIFNSDGEPIQWMDERGLIHNGRGVFFKVKEVAK